MADDDGVIEEAAGALRMQIMAAAQAARAAIGMRQQLAENAARRDLEQARQIQARLDAERTAARAELARVHESSWWNQAEPGDVARAYETAVTWRDEDDAARAAESRIRQELRDRYNIEVNETAADPAVVRARLLDPDRKERQEERGDAEFDRDEATLLNTEADVLETQAAVSDARTAPELRDEAAQVEHDAIEAWDSAHRRDVHADRLSTAGEPVAAAAWKQADVDNARNPREAVKQKPAKSPRTRVRTAGADRQIERVGR